MVSGLTGDRQDVRCREPVAADTVNAGRFWSSWVLDRYHPAATIAAGLRRLPVVGGLADVALLFAVMVRYAFLARRVDQTAAVLAVPEVAWTAFATVLSTAVAAKNG